MMRPVSLLFLLIFSSQLFAATEEKRIDDSLETKLANFKIDQYFRAGEYLVYDCQKKAYTCVDENSFETCKLRREDSKNKKQKEYWCAPLKKFENREKCLQQNYATLEAVHITRFCAPIND
jgi:hypothetical protein